MNVYTVHLKGAPDDPAALERVILVREGFSWAAFVFGPAWLLWNRAWLAFSLALAMEAALAGWGSVASPGSSVLVAMQVLLHLALGFEAGQIRRARLATRGFAMIGLVQGRRLVDAEHAVFVKFGAAPRTSTDGSSAPPHMRNPEMVGLFPSAGVSP